MKNFNLSVGAVVFGAAGIGCKVVAIDGDCLTIDTPKGIRTISAEKVVKVIPSLPPTSIEIGDRLRRNPQPQTKYPKDWSPNGIDTRQPMTDAIESATVEKFSPDGYWVATPEGKTYHVSESSIEAVDWELIERNYQQK